MTTSRSKRVYVEPGIYRRGDTYEIRVTGYDTTGKRRHHSKTVGKSLRQAWKPKVSLWISKTSSCMSLASMWPPRATQNARRPRTSLIAERP